MSAIEVVDDVARTDKTASESRTIARLRTIAAEQGGLGPTMAILAAFELLCDEPDAHCDVCAYNRLVRMVGQLGAELTAAVSRRRAVRS